MNDPADKLLEHASFLELAQRLRALYSEERDALLLAMLGQEYVIGREGITLRGQKAPENHVAVIHEYLSSRGSAQIITPWRGLGTFPGGVPAEFREQVELPLAHHAPEFSSRARTVLPLLDGELSASMIGSDVAFTVRALPQVALHVELSEETTEFSSEAWVLFSNNADDFLSARGMHLLGELFKDRLLGLLRIY